MAFAACLPKRILSLAAWLCAPNGYSQLEEEKTDEEMRQASSGDTEAGKLSLPGVATASGDVTSAVENMSVTSDVMTCRLFLL